jgi:predicted RNA methylase
MKLLPGCHKAFKQVTIERENDVWLIKTPKMARKDYEQFKVVVNAMRGEWVRKKDAHVFGHDPSIEVSQLAETGIAPDYISNPYSFFPTPYEEVEEMVNILAQLRNYYGARVAETGAGDGRIIQSVLRACPDADIHYWEIDDRNRQLLAPMRATLQGEDFLSADIESLKGTFDFVLMNPEFSGKAYQEHVRRSFELLKIGGTLISVMPAMAIVDKSFRDWMFQNARASWYVGEYEFSDTKVKYITVEIRNQLSTKAPYGYDSWDSYNAIVALKSDFRFHEALWDCRGKNRVPKITTIDRLKDEIVSAVDRMIRFENMALCLDAQTFDSVTCEFAEEIGLEIEPIAVQLSLC